MEITIEQIKMAEAGQPVRLKVAGHSDLYLVNLELFKKLASPTLGSRPGARGFSGARGTRSG